VEQLRICKYFDFYFVKFLKITFLLICRLTVQKAGPNQGRKFYKCSTCNFFEWEDAAADGGGGSSNNDFSNQNSGFNNNNNNKSKNNNFGNKSTNKGSKSGDTPKKRKCGICGQEGHNRKNCPNLN
jgi:DNA topoisomerase-3